MENIINGIDSIKELKKGVDIVAKTVGVTLGPKGKNVVIENNYGMPEITNDGVTIAKSIKLKNKAQNLGANIIVEASVKTNDTVGDGTTTACILTKAIVEKGIEKLSNNFSAVAIKSGILKASDFVCRCLKKASKKIKTSNQILQIATISAGDANIGNIVLSAVKKVGNDGVVTCEEGQGISTTLSVSEGMQIQRGFVSPYMANDSIKQNALLENCYVFVCRNKLEKINEITPLLEKLIKSGEKLFIVAPDFSSEIVSMFVLNKLRGVFDVVCIKAPVDYSGSYDSLDDISALCGTNTFATESGNKIQDIELSSLGRAKKITVSKDISTIVAYKNNLLENRIEYIKEKMQSCSKEEYNDYALRLAKLSGGIAIIKVGAHSELEVYEKKLRIEDAINATKAAINDGIVAGGGIALFDCIFKLKSELHKFDDEEKAGGEIVLECLCEPLKQIAKNCDKNFDVIAKEIQKQNKTGFGYDGKNDKFGDMYKLGVVDPLKVTMSALQTAASVAATMLTTDAIVMQNVEEKL